MKKFNIVLITLMLLLFPSVFLVQNSPLFNQPYSWNSFGGAAPEQPSTIYLGDQGTFGCSSWADCDGQWPRWRVVIHTSSNIDNGSFGDFTTFQHIEHKTNTSPRFTSVGTWYWGIQVDYSLAGYWWYCRNSSTGYLMWANPTSDLNITVLPLNNPSAQAATASGTTVTLNWQKDDQSHFVMIVRKSSSASWTEPSQGTAYTVGSPIGSGEVVYFGSDVLTTTNTVVSSSSYDYKFYSENNRYYSAGVTASVTTGTATNNYFQSIGSGNWNETASWQSVIS